MRKLSKKPERNFAQNFIEKFQIQNKPNEDLAKAIRNYLHKKEVEKQKAYIV